MDTYSLVCVAATAVAIALRRWLPVRVLAVALLLWVGYTQHLNVKQAERMLIHHDAGADQPRADEVRPLEAGELLRVLQREPAGFLPFLCAGVLALVPVDRRPQRPAAAPPA